jgi:hypothetical protein
MLAELRNHVVKEWNARAHINDTGAIQLQFDKDA